ncbi:MAG: pirin family protein [Xanthomonadales bacterium]|jgi:redox-sensitive bicupin YhaK (pirin superfamily)|nr:pirin family protein [Xanthomonadales bacterium]
MDIQIIRSGERGRTRLAWLDSRHSFSFGHYYDPKRMGHGALRVINEDVVAPAKGFSTHPHANMEIVSIVLSGALAHRDSMGNVQTIRAGEVQRMSAGTGIEHSEFNPSDEVPVHFLQVWLHPLHRDQSPSYQQRDFSSHDQEQGWLPVVTGSAQGLSLAIDQDAGIYLSRLPAGTMRRQQLETGRRGYLQITGGCVLLGENELNAGDGVAFTGRADFALQAITDAAAVWFDLA